MSITGRTALSVRTRGVQNPRLMVNTAKFHACPIVRLGEVRPLGGHAPRSVLDSYLLRAMALSGWAPALDACARCGAEGPHDWFVAQLGGSVCGDCAPAGSARVRPETRQLLSALIAGEWSVVDAATSAATAAASGLVAAYTQYHLERGIRSLSHLSHLETRR